VLTHLLLNDLKKAATAEDGDARIVVVASSMHDVEFSKKRGREYIRIITMLMMTMIMMNVAIL